MNQIQFLEICETLMKADIVIIEIATLKFFKTENIYLSNEHFKALGIKPNSSGLLTKRELINNLNRLESLIENSGKKVLFISHFNNNNISNRSLIIESLKNTVKYFFDPTSIIDSEDKLVDQNHYTLNTELLIMDGIHSYLSKM